MKMTKEEALNTLGIKGAWATKEVIKKSYRRLASIFHPDRNPDGLAVMQRVNAAYTFLSGMPDVRPLPHSSVIDVGGVTIVKEYGKTIVSGDTFPIKQIFKKHDFKWNNEDKVWWCYGTYPIEDYLNAT